MRRAKSFGALAAVALAALATAAMIGAASGCNSGNGDCPDKSTIAPGASCSDDHLQCAFDLSTPAAACDGTTTVLATSCTCNHGTWDCPAPFDCDAGDGATAADDGASDAAGEASTDDASTDDAGGD